MKFLKIVLFASFCFAPQFAPQWAFCVEMAVTVDDLPTTGSMPSTIDRPAIARKIISALKKHSVPEPFGFINAKQIDDAPPLAVILREWTAAGFPIGNHTYSHLNLENVGADEFIADIRRNEPALRLFSAGRNFKFFRYPYLREGLSEEKRKLVRDALATGGYRIAPVSVYFDDWAWNEAYARCADKKDETGISMLKSTFLDSARRQFQWTKEMSLKSNAPDANQILLVHIGAFDAVMLDDLLAQYEKAGVKFVTLNRALEDKIYSADLPISSAGELPYWERVRNAHPEGYPSPPEYPMQDLERACQ